MKKLRSDGIYMHCSRLVKQEKEIISRKKIQQNHDYWVVDFLKIKFKKLLFICKIEE